ncbi:hypothetical protein Y032_0043g801 [Ancylostoma ceylanicum]|uniref:Uncharacterized protein n=1 Tax=Ancylostoma ceylanicum TaxID=53326 RepID=A0A016UFG5_9BILA|nr:hypothetical protein Y032_0043g801 [Ancylostoma ceylanicum]
MRRAEWPLATATTLTLKIAARKGMSEHIDINDDSNAFRNMDKAYDANRKHHGDRGGAFLKNQVLYTIRGGSHSLTTSTRPWSYTAAGIP